MSPIQHPLPAGKRTRGYACCLPSAGDHPDGCTRGPHVFYESDPAQLHVRHAFTESPPMSSSTLDIAALDCEMVYTTGGFRIARISVVNAGGKEVFDELIKMDDGVEVVCVVLSPSSQSACRLRKMLGILIHVSRGYILISTLLTPCLLWRPCNEHWGDSSERTPS